MNERKKPILFEKLLFEQKPEQIDIKIPTSEGYPLPVRISSGGYKGLAVLNQNGKMISYNLYLNPLFNKQTIDDLTLACLGFPEETIAEILSDFSYAPGCKISRTRGVLMLPFGTPDGEMAPDDFIFKFKPDAAGFNSYIAEDNERDNIWYGSLLTHRTAPPSRKQYEFRAEAVFARGQLYYRRGKKHLSPQISFIGGVTFSRISLSGIKELMADSVTSEGIMPPKEADIRKYVNVYNQIALEDTPY